MNLTVLQMTALTFSILGFLVSSGWAYEDTKSNREEQSGGKSVLCDYIRRGPV